MAFLAQACTRRGIEIASSKGGGEPRKKPTSAETLNRPDRVQIAPRFVCRDMPFGETANFHGFRNKRSFRGLPARFHYKWESSLAPSASRGTRFRLPQTSPCKTTLLTEVSVPSTRLTSIHRFTRFRDDDSEGILPYTQYSRRKLLVFVHLLATKGSKGLFLRQ